MQWCESGEFSHKISPSTILALRAQKRSVYSWWWKKSKSCVRFDRLTDSTLWAELLMWSHRSQLLKKWRASNLVVVCAAGCDRNWQITERRVTFCHGARTPRHLKGRTLIHPSIALTCHQSAPVIRTRIVNQSTARSLSNHAQNRINCTMMLIRLHKLDLLYEPEAYSVNYDWWWMNYWHEMITTMIFPSCPTSQTLI